MSKRLTDPCASALGLAIWLFAGSPSFAQPDPYEPDDYYWEANPIVLDGPYQAHTFYPQTDVDWVMFFVQTGRWCKARALNCQTGADPALTLYEAPVSAWGALSEIGSVNENGWGEPETLYFLPANPGALYYLKAEQGLAGAPLEETGYDLSVDLVRKTPNLLVVSVLGIPDGCHSPPSSCLLIDGKQPVPPCLEDTAQISEEYTSYGAGWHTVEVAVADGWIPRGDYNDPGDYAYGNPRNVYLEASGSSFPVFVFDSLPSVTPSPAPSPTPSPAAGFCRGQSGDYDGDGVSDPAVFNPLLGRWAVRSLSRFYFGSAPDLPVPGDYDGDGTAEAAVFRPPSGLWALRGFSRFSLGSSADLPAPADYDGDGTAEAAVFRPGSGLWAFRSGTRLFFGGSASEPVPGDYAGDGSSVAAVFDPLLGAWAVRSLTRFCFGSSSDEPIPGDYDGDGTWSAAIFRPALGLWAVSGLTRGSFGQSGDLPAPARYLGGRLVCPAVFRPSSGLWAVVYVTRHYFGGSGDLSVTR